MTHKTLKEVYDDLGIKPRTGDRMVIAYQSFTIVDQHHDYFKSGGEWHHFSDELDGWNIIVLDELYRDSKQIYPRVELDEITKLKNILVMHMRNGNIESVVDVLILLIDAKIKEAK